MLAEEKHKLRICSVCGHVFTLAEREGGLVSRLTITCSKECSEKRPAVQQEQVARERHDGQGRCRNYTFPYESHKERAARLDRLYPASPGTIPEK